MHSRVEEYAMLTRDFARRYRRPEGGFRVCRFGREAHAVVEPHMQESVTSIFLKYSAMSKIDVTYSCSSRVRASFLTRART